MVSEPIVAGLSKVEITPEIKTLEVFGLGYWFRRSVRFTGIRDPLYVRTLVLGEGKACQIIVSVDAIFDSYGFIADALSRITHKLAVARANVFITCNHSHSTPLIGLNNAGQGADYGSYVAERVVASVHEAFRMREPLLASLCQGRIVGALRNRRPLLTDGKVAELHTVPDSYAIADPGPIHDTLTMLKLRRRNGHLVGGFCHFGIHGVAIQCSDLISSDCMGRAIQQIELDMGNDVTMLHLNGPCADIDPVVMGNTDALDKMVEILVSGIRSISLSIEKPIALAPQASLQRGHIVRRRDARLDALKQGNDHSSLDDASSSPSHHSGAGYDRFLWQEEIAVSQMPNEFEIPYQLLRIGDLILVGVSGEIFTSFGLAMARAANQCLVLPVGIVGGWNGYLPPEHAFQQGGYEVACARWCPIAPGESEKLFASLEADLTTCDAWNGQSSQQ